MDTEPLIIRTAAICGKHRVVKIAAHIRYLVSLDALNRIKVVRELQNIDTAGIGMFPRSEPTAEGAECAEVIQFLTKKVTKEHEGELIQILRHG